MQKLSRRHVLATMSSGAVMLCPAFLNAQTVTVDWAGVPTTEPIGQDTLINVEAGPAQVDISALQPGEIAVIARPTDDVNFSNTGMVQYIAVHHRTDSQVAFGEANDRDGTTQDPRYFVANLVCTHRGKAIGMTGNPDAPFACTDRGSRHSSNYDPSGKGIGGASVGEFMSIPDYTLDTSNGVVLSLA